MLDPAAAVLGSHTVGKQAALVNLCSGLVTGGTQKSALGSSELRLVVAQVISSQAFFCNLLSAPCHAEPSSAPASGRWVLTALMSALNCVTLFTPGSRTALLLYTQRKHGPSGISNPVRLTGFMVDNGVETTKKSPRHFLYQ